jgi:hypothetical protein
VDEDTAAEPFEQSSVSAAADQAAFREFRSLVTIGDLEVTYFWPLLSAGA